MTKKTKVNLLENLKEVFLILAIIAVVAMIGIVVVSQANIIKPDETVSYRFNIPEEYSDVDLTFTVPSGVIDVLSKSDETIIFYHTTFMDLRIHDNNSDGLTNAFDVYTFNGERLIYGNNPFMDAIVKRIHLSMTRSIRFASGDLGAIDAEILDSIDEFHADSNLYSKSNFFQQFRKVWVVIVMGFKTDFVQSSLILLTLFWFGSLILVSACKRKLDYIIYQ